MIRAIVTDIEGTTSSLSFVKDVLFPYARQALAGFIRAHHDDPEVRRWLMETAALAGRPLTDDEAVIELTRWIDEDRKATPLKALQGMIWEEGYRSGAFKGHVYEDAVRRLREWHARGIRLYVFSSGSVQAQKLLFAHTGFGDLTPLFSGYFDTTIGSKREAASYARIVDAVKVPAGSILFLSDITEELIAAAAAGMRVMQLVREGDIQPGGMPPQVADFDAIQL